MLYMLAGYLHAAIFRRVRLIRRLAGETGQGTVEYVGLILLVALLMVGMVAAMKGFNRSFRKTCNLASKIAEVPRVGGKVPPSFLHWLSPVP